MCPSLVEHWSKSIPSYYSSADKHSLEHKAVCTLLLFRIFHTAPLSWFDLWIVLWF